MSCWVVPAVAAEFWGLTVEQVLERIRKGTVTWKQELGFTLVDVAPASPKAKTGIRPPAARPATFVSAKPPSAEEELEEQILSEAEMEALLAFENDELDEDDQRLDWHAARAATSRLRRAPSPAAMAA
mgnify:CR=1 FL=1